MTHLENQTILLESHIYNYGVNNNHSPYKLFFSILLIIALALVFTFGSFEYGHAGETTKPFIHIVKNGETLSEIALHYHVSLKQLRGWNSLHGDKIFVGQRLKLRLPASCKSYVVKTGDTLSDIAIRFGVSIPLLRRINNISKDRIYPGQELTLVQSKKNSGNSEDIFEYIVKKGDNLSIISQRFDVGLKLLQRLNQLKGSRIYPGQRLQLRPTSLDEAVHVVRPGETLSSIAKKYRVKLSEIIELNGIEGSKILIGQKLRLKKTPIDIHIVERGDALWEIARAYGTTVKKLIRINGLTSDSIYPGQELKLGMKQSSPLDMYTVKKGDYLGRIARLHQMSVAELKKMNNIKSSVIYKGQKILVNPILHGPHEWSKISKINWEDLMALSYGTKRIKSGNGPYYFRKPTSTYQKDGDYYEAARTSLSRTYRQAQDLWNAFEQKVDSLGRLSNTLSGWHIVLDPGHGGLDPGAVVENLDGNGNKVYVVEDEYVYDIALRVYVLLRLHNAEVEMTLLSPNHLIRHSNPPTRTFVNEKNEVYNSYELNRENDRSNRPTGGRNGNLSHRVTIARKAFKNTPRKRRIFLSFHADINDGAPEAPFVLYYKNRSGSYCDQTSRKFAKAILPSLGAGSYVRGRNLGVLRNNPARIKVVLELRNLAYTDHAWALRFEQLRHRDAEKVVRGILDYVCGKAPMAHSMAGN